MPGTNPPTRKRFIIAVPALYWDRDDGLTEGYGFQRETVAASPREALAGVIPELVPSLCRTQAHFRTFQVAVARCSRRSDRRKVQVYNVRRTGRVLGRELYPWLE